MPQPIGKEQNIKDILDRARTGSISVVEAQDEIKKLIPLPSNPNAQALFLDLKRQRPGITKVYDELIRLGSFIPGMGPLLTSFATLQDLVHESGIPLSQRTPGEALLRGILGQIIPPKPESVLGGIKDFALSALLIPGSTGLLLRAAKGAGARLGIKTASEALLGGSRALESGVTERLLASRTGNVGAVVGEQLKLPLGEVGNGSMPSLIREGVVAPEQLELAFRPPKIDRYPGIQLEIWDIIPQTPEQLELKLGNPGTRLIENLKKRGYSEPVASAVLGELEMLKGMPPPLATDKLSQTINDIPKTVLERYFIEKEWLGTRGWATSLQKTEKVAGLTPQIIKPDEKAVQVLTDKLSNLKYTIEGPLIPQIQTSETQIKSKALTKQPLVWSNTEQGKFATEKMEKFKEKGKLTSLTSGGAVRGLTPKYEYETLAKGATADIPSITRNIRVTSMSRVTLNDITASINYIKSFESPKIAKHLSELIQDFNSKEITQREFIDELANVEKVVSLVDKKTFGDVG